MAGNPKEIGFSVNRFPRPGKADKLPEIPFFRHFIAGWLLNDVITSGLPTIRAQQNY
jgi:hypothetical protein